MSEISRYTDHSEKIKTDDIDWDLGARAGLTDTEKFMLRYFSDIEYQTVMYMRDLLHTKAIEDPDMVSFLCMWNYEEHFHGQALSQLLSLCGVDIEKSRIAETRKKVTLHEKITGWGASLFSKIFTHDYPALFMTWGAINELTTLRAYERLEETTQNPVLKFCANALPNKSVVILPGITTKPEKLFQNLHAPKRSHVSSWKNFGHPSVKA
ncbi:MAG: hypothetical protein IPJ69_06775 [Deltaproteobacteria bacterium]|nr:MAG: hypothetical protein IPJ69_06775 [Deltaproteobacteria bacterium]